MGIILAVLVLTVALHNRGGVMTDEKVIARAGELGMVMPGDTEELQSTESTESTENTFDATEPVSEEVLPAATAEPESESESEPETTGNQQMETGTSSGTLNTDSGTIEIEVENGDACRQVAEKLCDKGLVEDAEEFRLFMANKGYDNRIYVGTYQLQEGMTYDEIAETLIKKP
jgi:hypothetical protein